MLHENGSEISETGTMAVKFGPIRILDVFFTGMYFYFLFVDVLTT